MLKSGQVANTKFQIIVERPPYSNVLVAKPKADSSVSSGESKVQIEPANRAESPSHSPYPCK